MLFDQVAATSAQLSATSARSAKVQLVADLLGKAARDEVPVLVAWLSGELTQRQIGVGWAALREPPEPASTPELEILAVEEQLAAIGQTTGAGSQARRRELLRLLFAAATEREQRFLRALLTGDLRQGALIGVMTDAVARAAGVGLIEVRRAAMLSGNLPVIAAAALDGGSAALAEFGLEVGRPIGPMLAQTAGSVAEALQRLGGRAAVEWKLDGIRIQVHRHGDQVRLFTRTLDDVTARMPEVVEAVAGLPVQDLVADGEVIALTAEGRPRPFQVTASRTGSRRPSGSDDVGLSAFLFDVMHVEGTDLLDEPAERRFEILERIVPAGQRVPRVVTHDPQEAGAFLDEALSRGHEGVMVKSLDARYEAGRRGAGWLKVKPVHTLDLVVVAVEWGSGRRSGQLSNIHLAARDPNGGFVMLGKTFKGMTDEMLRWQTERFLALADGPTDGWVVPLRPEQVVEIAFDGLQRSSRYPGGLALRFARVLRYRDDKSAAEADTIEAVRALGGIEHD
jgi:ATP-dependent DNA ligase I